MNLEEARRIMAGVYEGQPTLTPEQQEAAQFILAEEARKQAAGEIPRFTTTEDWRAAGSPETAIIGGPPKPKPTPENIEEETARFLEVQHPYVEITGDVESGEASFKVDVPAAIDAGVPKEKLIRMFGVGYVTEGEAFSTQRVALKELADYQTDEGYDVASAIIAGKINEVRAAFGGTEEANLALVDAQVFVSDNTKLPDGNWINKTDLSQIKQDNPEAYQLLTTKGFEAADKYIGDYNTNVAEQNAQIERQNALVDKLNLDKDGNFNPVEFLRANKDTGVADLKEMGFTDKEVAEWQKTTINPMYLNTLYLAAVKAKQNELLKTTKPELLEDSTSYTLRIDGLAQAEAYKQFSPEEQKLLTKEAFVSAEGILIPGVETAAHWAYLSTKDKVVAVSWDVANVAVMLWGGKIVGAAVKGVGGKLGLTGISRLNKLATTAGKTADDLNSARQSLEGAMTAGSDATVIRLRGDALEAARTASKVADKSFFTKLEIINRLSPKQLRLLEQKSGVKGLADSIQGVSRASKDVEIAWKSIDKSRFYTDPKGASQIYTNNQHLLRLANLQNAQANLELSLQRAGSTLTPRYKVLEPPQAFQRALVESENEIARTRALIKAADPESNVGYLEKRLRRAEKTLADLQERQAQGRQLGIFGATTGRLIPYTRLEWSAKLSADKETLDEINRFLESKLKPSQGKPLTAKQIKLREELDRLAKQSRAKYEAEVQKGRVAVAEQKAEALAKAQKVTLPKTVIKPKLKPSELPVIKPEPFKPIPFRLSPKQKGETKVKPEAIPSEEYGRLTLAQMERYYGEGVQVDVRSQSITKALSRTQGFTELTPAEWTQVDELVKAGVKAQAKAGVQDLTKVQARDAVREAVQQKANEQVRVQPQAKTVTQTNVQAITNTIVDTPVKPPTKPRIKPSLPIKPRGKVDSDTQKRETIVNAGGAVAWSQGRLNDKPVWHTVVKPYTPQDHIVVVGKTPEGAKLFPGPGEAYRSITLLRGQGPSKPTRLEGGAVDPVLYTPKDGKGIAISFIKDTSVRKRYKRFSKSITKPSEVGSGIVETRRSGKTIRHLALT